MLNLTGDMLFIDKKSPPAAQRLALLALGRGWILFESRKNSKPEKCSKMPQNPQRPVHALLLECHRKGVAEYPRRDKRTGDASGV